MKSIEEHRNHVQELLELNPGRDAAEIIRLRQSYLSQGVHSPPDELKRTREAMTLLNATLAECRANFWKYGDEDINELLQSNRFAIAPELAQAASRLLSWYQLRDRIGERTLTSDSRSFQGSTSPLIVPIVMLSTMVLVFILTMLSIWLGL